MPDGLPNTTREMFTPTIELGPAPDSTTVVNPEPTRVSVVTPAPSTEVAASPASSTPDNPTVSPVKAPPLGTIELAISDLHPTDCALNSGFGSGNWGTAPGPTPTSIERPEHLDGVTRDAYIRRAHSITVNLLSWSEDFENLWVYDLNPQQEAAALNTLSLNTSRLCDAVELLEPSLEFLPVDELLRESLRSRHAWSSLAIEHLVTLGSSRSEIIEMLRKSSHGLISEVQSALEDLSATRIRSDVEIELSQLDLRFVLPERWVLGGTERQPIILAPYELQFVDQRSAVLGTWEYGTAARLRRFRNFAQTTSSEAAEKFVGLANRLGNVVNSSSGLMFGVDTISTQIFNEEVDMTFVQLIAVAGDYTFIVDYGCQSEEKRFCDAVADVVEGIRIVEQAS
ncbi:hypothetical protein [Candidatus Lucifugimonas marina]|uniref:Uncharacterized protein n=1 Tax=Candidatus Lucifugimonas marina TaxID=3038979 RepID=A0AAJ5ZCH9_9CHLR|nr:hypothetical protein [SAR202 cluster bacterium JH702]MDG0868252.1 hypothetical protein [SAR202 cluster bacterium JH639]WFG34896.1 hypothetical protein GKN94_04075 [SAR202 cluster bacterium JH545]WFG38847.1 hypothetical protein GKO48_04210 [SAR202 cluster bacterium JH1073]